MGGLLIPIESVDMMGQDGKARPGTGQVHAYQDWFALAQATPPQGRVESILWKHETVGGKNIIGAQYSRENTSMKKFPSNSIPCAVDEST